jgi:phosphomethylpyrimidine kinase
MKAALTIAGSDSSGGAGIQADLKTMTLNGVFAMSAITALTAQNTMGVTDIVDVEPDFLKAQLDAVFEDIYPDAVKIGMVSDKKLIETIAEKLIEYDAKNIVLDPVMVATSGSKLLKDDAIGALKERLIPLAELITPNIPEAEILSGLKIKDDKDMQKSAKVIADNFDVNVLLKGGHAINDANDFLLVDGNSIWIKGDRIDNKNTHGTGCTLSSAIAANLAKNKSIEEAVRLSKKYLEGALKDGLDLGKGSGPMNHAFDIKEEYKA